MSRREEYTEATRRALVSAGREIFANEGFQSAGIEAISRAARVTRGAFYHHFDDKKALFDAVVVALQAEAAARIARTARTYPKIWDRLHAGVTEYLEVCLEPTYARIVVQESPAVLGHRRHREIEEAHPMSLLTATLVALKRNGELAFADIKLLSRMLDAMICKLALLLSETRNPAATRSAGQEVVDALLAAFRRSEQSGKV